MSGPAVTWRERETEMPARTVLAAASRFAGEIRFKVPSSSADPQRPAFETSLNHRSNVSRGTNLADCARGAPAGRRMRRWRTERRHRAFMVLSDGEGRGGTLPNGSRLSCGRNTRRRKAVEQQTKRRAGEATQFLPTCERPAASSAW